MNHHVLFEAKSFIKSCTSFYSEVLNDIRKGIIHNERITIAFAIARSEVSFKESPDLHRKLQAC